MTDEDVQQAPNDSAYKRWSYHNDHKLLCKLCRTIPPQKWGPDILFFFASRPYGPAGWQALLFTKAGGFETNPGPTTSNKQVWICDICYKQIHGRMQISIMCNMIEHQQMRRYPTSTIHRYLDLPSTQIIQTHNSHRHNTTPPLQTLIQAPAHSPHTPSTPPQPKHRHTSNTSPVPTGLVNTKSKPLIHSPHLHPCRPEQNVSPNQPTPPNSKQINHLSPNHIYTKSTPNHIHHHYVPSVTLTYTAHIISLTAPTHAPHGHSWICGQTSRTDCAAGKMDGEAGWWTTSGNIGLPPLAMVIGVSRQQEVQHCYDNCS